MMMRKTSNDCAPFLSDLLQPRHLAKLLPLALFALSSSPVAKADTVTDIFTISGGNVTASGTLTYQTTSTPGLAMVTAITGTFSQTGAGGFSGDISGLVPGSYDSTNPTVTANTLDDFDNLFYTSGSTPSCIGQSSSVSLDYCGVEFNVAGGYEVNLYGSGANFQVDDYLASGSNYIDLSEVVQLTASPTPEPSALILVGTGLLGVCAAGRRRFSKSV